MKENIAKLQDYNIIKWRGFDAWGELKSGKSN
jgi:hypothetical protein